MKIRITALLVPTLATLFAASNAFCDTVVYQRTNTDNIEIPRFDPSMGTLDSVMLEITMLGGSTNSNGSHSHGSRQFVSTNVFNAGVGGLGGGFSTRNYQTSSVNAVPHSFVSQGYAGGGINIGSFSGSTNSGPGHTHNVTVSSIGPVQVGSTSFRWRVNAATNSAGTHGHSFNSQTKNLNFNSQLELDALTGLSDLVITAGSFGVASNGNHSHNLNGFTIPVSTSAGTFNYTFASSQTNTGGNHNHVIDPRFNVTATYMFTAIPEPATSMLLCGALVGLAVVRKRR